MFTCISSILTYEKGIDNYIDIPLWVYRDRPKSICMFIPWLPNQWLNKSLLCDPQTIDLARRYIPERKQVNVSMAITYNKSAHEWS